MKKLTLRNSIFSGLAFLLLLGACKAKKKVVQAEPEAVPASQVQVDTVQSSTDHPTIIHSPGTLDQKSLDSIKEIKNRNKRNFTK